MGSYWSAADFPNLRSPAARYMSGVCKIVSRFVARCITVLWDVYIDNFLSRLPCDNKSENGGELTIFSNVDICVLSKIRINDLQCFYKMINVQNAWLHVVICIKWNVDRIIGPLIGGIFREARPREIMRRNKTQLVSKIKYVDRWAPNFAYN